MRIHIGENLLRAKGIFIAFFLIFTLALIAVPIPLFPGNLLQSVTTANNNFLNSLLISVINGFIYGLITWLIFIMFYRRIEKNPTTDHKKTQQ